MDAAITFTDNKGMSKMMKKLIEKFEYYFDVQPNSDDDDQVESDSDDDDDCDL